MQLDIVEFYPSITEELLDKALDFAEQHTEISEQTRNIVKQSRQALLFTQDEKGNKTAWTKQKSTFDVTMGAPDGAEICELVGLFLLSEVKAKFPELNFGLYRDDGMAEHRRIGGRRLNAIRQGLQDLFQQHGLRITIEAPNMIVINFLDVTLNLEKGTYCPYRKPNDTPLYVHSKSNHPPNVLKTIPVSINKRLSTISSSKEEFDLAKEPYQRALNDSGHNYELTYEEPTQQQKRKSRKRDILWFNPPFNAAVTTNIGAIFLQLLDKHFPRSNPLHRILNRNTVKVSYSCTGNIKSTIQSHNMKLLTGKKEDDPQKKPCNCQRSRRENCPLKGECNQQEVIYHATVKTEEEERKYVGCTVDFKRRFYGHTSSFRHEKKRNSTALAGYVWEKDLGPEPEIEWSILSHARAYRVGNRTCDLCLTEKVEIAKNFSDPQYLNKRGELSQKCRHKSRFLLQPPPRKKGEDDQE